MSRVLAPIVLVLIGITAITITMAAARPKSSAPHLSARLAGTNVWPSGARPAPSFALRDQNGRIITRSGMRGRIWAITFLDSHCREACPVAATSLAHVQQMLGAHDPLSIVIVSVLPQYDTPTRVRAFAHKAGLTGRWYWLLGTRRQLEPVWNEYGIAVLTGEEHTAAVYLVDRRGDVRVADAVPFIPTQLAGSVRALDRLRIGQKPSSGA